MVAVRCMQQFEDTHQPVMQAEAVSALLIQPNGVYVDATFGRGGHSGMILDNLGPNGRLLAIDRDPAAVAVGREIFAADSRFSISHGAFADLSVLLEKNNLSGKVNGILFDLGVSSPQLDDPERGFSFMREGPLDMRMDCSQGMDAATWLMNVSEEDLANVLWRYGEERFSRRIARAVVMRRADVPIRTTLQLAECVSAAIPKWPQKGKHPATRSFQAIRIFINAEFEQLECGLKAALSQLAPKGRLAVISFHSLEDRIVKQFMRLEEQGEILPRGLPIKESVMPRHFRCVGRAVMPTAAEIASNPRSRSAVLRVGEKLS